MKHIWKILLAGLGIFCIFLFIWLYGWYTGKVAPSDVDTSVIEVDEAVAYFAGGCFWCTESDYEKLHGVKEAISGYMGGELLNPSYNEVSSGVSGHREVVKVVYDPSVVSYQRLALFLLQETDPTDADGSFYDRGHQYSSAIYYQTPEEKSIAESVIARVGELGVFDKPITTVIEEAGAFWLAEEYHQDFYKKSSLQYKYYRNASGRDAFIENAWGDGKYDEELKDILENKTNGASAWSNFQKPDDKVLKETLTPIQYKVTQKDGTEKPFENEYWDNHEEGIYVDIVSGEPLFSSTDKYDSGTGWPSFLKPIDKDFVTEHDDYKLFVRRTEIRSKYADSHIGHIILDGPIENDKIRYCMNSAAMRFVPKDEMQSGGYGDFLYLFNQ